MTSFSLLKKIMNHWKGNKYDPSTDNDLSYEDALLEWKIKRFMLSEYGDAQPPQGIFGRVMAAIKTQQNKTKGVRADLVQFISGFGRAIYNLLAKPTAASRIVPSIVAFGFVIAVLSTGTHNLIFETTYEGPRIEIESPPAAISPDEFMRREIAELAKKDLVTVRGNVPEGLGQFYPPANIEFYHPFERHIPSKKHVESTSAQKVYKMEELITSQVSGF